MARRSEWDEQWRQLAAVLRQYRQSGGLTLAEAQQLFDAAPDVHLSPAFVQSILAQIDQCRSADTTSTACHVLGDWIFCTSTLMPIAAGLVEPPSVIGIHGGHASTAGLTRIQSDVVDTRRISMAWPVGTWDRGTQPTDSIVLDVSLDCQELDRSQVCRIRQGTVLWDACIDGHGLDARQVASLFDSWCDSAEYEQDFIGRIRQS